jgi:hypothetical protein
MHLKVFSPFEEKCTLKNLKEKILCPSFPAANEYILS